MGEVSKRVKIIKSGECEATFTLLIAFRGGFVEGVRVVWRVGIKNLGYRKFLRWCV